MKLPLLNISILSLRYRSFPCSFITARVLGNLKEGNIVFFVFSLAPYDNEVYKERDTRLKNFQRGRKNKYIAGFFTIKGVARVSVLKSEPKLGLAWFNVASGEEGDVPLETKGMEKTLELLEDWNYIVKEGENYRLTLQGSESSRSGRELVQVVFDLWPDNENAQRALLEKGNLDILTLSGKVTEEDVKASFHYRRLKGLDWDQFVLVKGDP